MTEIVQGSLTPPSADLRANLRHRAAGIREAIYNRYHEDITSGRLPVSSKLPTERALADEFGTTRKTIREALTMLEADGLICRQVGAGTFVQGSRFAHDEPLAFPTPSVSPMDVIEARSVIEPTIAGLAVRRATNEDFARMEKCLMAMVQAPNQTALKKAGYMFHLEVIRATRNKLLITMYEMLIAARERAGWGLLLPLNDRQELKDQQIGTARTILQGLRDRDLKRTETAYHKHLGRLLETATSLPHSD